MDSLTKRKLTEPELADGRRTVLEVTPAPGTPTLTYERDMMRGELEFVARAAARRRRSLYKIYPALIMFTEVPTRGFAGPAHQGYLDWASGFLHRELELLDQSRATTTTPRARARHHERITT